MCEVVSIDGSQFWVQCDNFVDIVRSNDKGDLMMLCEDHHYVGESVFPHIETGEVAIARAMAYRARQREWEARTGWFGAKSDPALWDVIHKPTADALVVSASAAASALGFGYMPRPAYYRAFHSGWPAPSEFVQQVFLDPGAANEPLALAALVSRLRLQTTVIGIDIEQRTWRGYKDEEFLAATPDGVVRTLEGDFAVEVKCPQTRIPEHPKPNHVLQLLLQMHLFRYKNDPAKRLRMGYLFYWTYGDTACFVVRYNKQTLDAVVDELKRFADCVREHKPLHKIDKQHYIDLVMKCVN